MTDDTEGYDDDDADDADDQTSSWASDLYDEIARRYTTPQPLTVLRKEWIEEVKEGIRTGRLAPPVGDLDDLLKAEFAGKVNPVRNKRAHNLVKVVGYLLDAIPEDGAYVDPVLDWATPIGDRTDKVLRFWTADDYARSGDIRRRRAVDEAAAAAEATRVFDAAIRRMTDERVVDFGRLFVPPGGAA